VKLDFAFGYERKDTGKFVFDILGDFNPNQKITVPCKRTFYSTLITDKSKKYDSILKTMKVGYKCKVVVGSRQQKLFVVPE
jgi:hypothetical protein